MHIRVSASVTGTVQELFSWWSDYTEGVVDDDSFTSVTRKIVSREGQRIVMEDHFTKPLRFTDRVVVTLRPPDVIEFNGESRIWRTRGIYTFTQKGEDVEAVSDIVLKPKGIWKFALGLMMLSGRLSKGFYDDLKGHLDEFAAERKKQALQKVATA